MKHFDGNLDAPRRRRLGRRRFGCGVFGCGVFGCGIFGGRILGRRIFDCRNVARFLSGEPIFQRSPRHPLHHEIGNGRVPTDRQDLDHIAIGRHLDQMADLAGQTGPIHPAAVQIEFDRHRSAGVAIAASPDFPERPRPDERFDLVIRNVGRRSATAQRQFAGRRSPVDGLHQRGRHRRSGGRFGIGFVGHHHREHRRGPV